MDGMHMVGLTKTVRNLDGDAYRQFRAKAVELGYSTGAALNEAIRMWVNAKSRPRVTVRAGVESTEPQSPLAVEDA
jgi:plasmid stability protein